MSLSKFIIGFGFMLIFFGLAGIVPSYITGIGQSTKELIIYALILLGIASPIVGWIEK